MIGDSQSRLEQLSGIDSQASMVAEQPQQHAEARAAAAGPSSSSSSSSSSLALTSSAAEQVEEFTATLSAAERALLREEKADWRVSLGFIASLGPTDLLSGAQTLRQQEAAAQGEGEGSGPSTASAIFLRFAEHRLSKLGGKADSSSSSSSTGVPPPAPPPLPQSSPGFDGMNSPELHSWAASFGLKAKGRVREELVVDVREAFAADTQGEGGGGEAAVQQQQGEGMGEGEGEEEQEEEQEGAVSLSSAEKLALVVKTSPSVHEAVLFMQPVPLRLVQGLATAAGLGTGTLAADLKALGVATRH